MSAVAPADWYRTSFAEDTLALYGATGGVEKVALALRILRPSRGERVLDLACGAGGRLLELCRRGFDVVGSDVDAGLVEAALLESDAAGLEPWFILADPRELDVREEREAEVRGEFDIVLSLGGGAFGHFGSDEEDLRAFEAVARALRPGGRLLMQLPNRLCAEAGLPPRSWFEADGARDTIAQRWNEAEGRIEGTRVSVVLDDPGWEDPAPAPFRRRIYSLAELERILDRAGLELVAVYDEQGAERPPTTGQYEIYVEARR